MRTKSILTRRLTWIIIILGILLIQQTGYSRDGWKKAEKIQWLKDNGIPLRTLEPTDEDFSDLMPLVEKIGDARVVMLGEQLHREGPNFLLKCRLVRFLHQVMDFDVLAWESGLYDCRKMEEALHTDMPLGEAADHGVFLIWTWSEQVRPVFQYARSTYGTPRPLIMAGFDSQFSASGKSKKTFSKDLRLFLEKAGLLEKAPPVWDFIDDIFDRGKIKGTSVKRHNQNDQNMVKLIQLLALSKSELLKVHSEQEVSFWIRVLTNYRVHYSILLFTFKDKGVTEWAFNNRDKAMGETLLWLAEKIYPKRKIIVWAATGHIARRTYEIDTMQSFNYKKRITMGNVVYEGLGDAVYSIGFTAYQGKYGSFRDNKIGLLHKPVIDSLDSLLHATGEKLLFVDFKSLRDDPGHWLNQPLKSRPMEHRMMRASWPRILDAMIFIDKMTPSTRIRKKRNKK